MTSAMENSSLLSSFVPLQHTWHKQQIHNLQFQSLHSSCDETQDFSTLKHCTTHLCQFIIHYHSIVDYAAAFLTLILKLQRSSLSFLSNIGQ